MTNGSEEWRDIKGYEGIYQISDCGRVKSLERIVPWGKGIRHIKEKFLRVKKEKEWVSVLLSLLRKRNCEIRTRSSFGCTSVHSESITQKRRKSY